MPRILLAESTHSAIQDCRGCKSGMKIVLMRMNRALVSLACGLLLVGAALAETRKVLVLPADFHVTTLGAGSTVTPNPEWTALAQENLTRATAELVRNRADWKLVELPELEPADRDALNEHIDLYRVVVAAVVDLTNNQNGYWRRNLEHTEFVLGSGLGFLADITGAEQALLLAGFQMRSTDGRKVLSALANVGSFLSRSVIGFQVIGRPVFELGDAHTTLAVIELRTGKISWLTQREVLTEDPRVPEEAVEAAHELFAPYPRKSLLEVRR
jgi:hypothetical protein